MTHTATQGNGAGASPLRSVLNAIEAGASTTQEIRSRTGLDPAVVDAAIGHLLRTGHLGSTSITLACGGSCSACPTSAGEASCVSQALPADGRRAAGPGHPGQRPAGGRPLLAVWARH